jgi:hypothetical protein
MFPECLSRGLADVKHAVLTLLAVLNEELAPRQVNVAHQQAAYFRHAQSTVPQEVETGQIANGHLAVKLALSLADGLLDAGFEALYLFIG